MTLILLKQTPITMHAAAMESLLISDYQTATAQTEGLIFKWKLTTAINVDNR